MNPTSNQDSELREKILSTIRSQAGVMKGTPPFGEFDKEATDVELTDRITSLITTLTDSHKREVVEAEYRTAVNAMAIALYWLEEDGRPKHLIQDMWSVTNIEGLDHIEQKYIDEAAAEQHQLNPDKDS